MATAGSPFGARVGRAVILSYAGHAIGLASGILVARLLGPSGKGALSLFVEAVYGLVMIAGLGVGDGQLYVVSRNRKQLVHFMPNARLLSAALGLVGGLLVYGGTSTLRLPPAAGWDRATLASAILVSPVMLLQVFQRQYLLATGRYAGAKAQSVVSMLLPLLAYGALGLLHLADWRFFVRAFTLVQALWVVAVEFVIARRDGPQAAPSLRFLQASWGFGVRQYGTGVVRYLTARIDFFLVASALGNQALGIYSVAVALSEIASRMTHEIGTILFPEFASGRLAPGHGARVFRKTLLVAGLAGLTTAVLGGFLVEGLFGREFSSATRVLRVLLLGTVAWSTIEVTQPHTSARGRPELGMLYYGLAAALDVMLNMVLLPRWGILGASVAAVASYLLAAGLFLHSFLAAERCTLAKAVLPTGRDVREVWRAVLSIPRGIHPRFRGGE